MGVMFSAQILDGCGFDFVGLVLVVEFLWFGVRFECFVGDSVLLPAYGLPRGGCCVDCVRRFVGVMVIGLGFVLISCLE